MKRWLRPWWIVAVVALAYMVAVVVSQGGDPLALATLGTRFSQGDSEGTTGYDGQFAYYIARDPLQGWRYCDDAPYRYQRILYPMLARLLALGQDWLLPYTLPLLNVAALAVGTWLTEQILRRHRISRWYALTYGLYAGQLMSARLDLNEPLAHALVQAAILAGERGRWRWTVLLFALSALTKETTLVFAVGYALSLIARRRWGRALSLTVGAGLPYLLWQGLLWLWLGSPGFGSGGEGDTGWELLPFRGLWSVGEVNLWALGLLALVMVPLVVIPALLSLWATGRELRSGRWHPFTTMLLTNALVIPFLPQSTFREFLAMLRLATGLVMAVILYGAKKRSKRTLNYTLLWLASLVFLTKEGTPP